MKVAAGTAVVVREVAKVGVAMGEAEMAEEVTEEGRVVVVTVEAKEVVATGVVAMGAVGMVGVALAEVTEVVVMEAAAKEAVAREAVVKVEEEMGRRWGWRWRRRRWRRG